MPITNKSPVSATNSKESPAAPAKPDEKKPAEAVKAATDSKAAPAAPAKPVKIYNDYIAGDEKELENSPHQKEFAEMKK